ncbi:MAG TPA: hypothetical protein VFE30_02645 [Anaeromyxobacteraceae bacterium]|jgi:hypothetical protein|nr:hypothetical protein [Anaeromyxobacteraceae bacterium]
MVGFGDQVVVVIPSLDLVVTRLGYARGGDVSAKLRRAVLPAVVAAARAAP